MNWHASDGRFMAVRLKPGANLIEGLRNIFAESAATAMAVVSCVGSLTQVDLRFADRPEATRLRGRFEILSLTGTMDAAHQHLHLSVADEHGQVRGGHLMASGSVVYTTAELVVAVLPGLHFARRPCALSGYDELTIAPV
ncbi:hypothetical protein SAMN05444339_106143 [Loktanella atrilutea]|uniref:PPC domain-containing protein n=1 Tax=Loktanella atrilutea TaxID=366533 RepID=A0A1M5BSD6_LOKAT|nr:DUF296 domain-containing protein [Loktanella atrilutea]SHF45187.1 hypothetical protein SAMN05444339_106143 [Loktanella atrilutea]